CVIFNQQQPQLHQNSLTHQRSDQVSNTREDESWFSCGLRLVSNVTRDLDQSEDSEPVDGGAISCIFSPLSNRKNIHLDYWSAVLGLHVQSNTNSEDVQTRRVDHIVIHREYNRLSKHGDIAMMHLQQPINFTRQ
ncbi:hypothetical protein GOODEAATRI_031831, partial [Goodea atripinnis]